MSEGSRRLGVARPAPTRRCIAALAALELRLTARRGENLLVMLVIPVAVLLFFGGPPIGGSLGGTIDTLVPGVVALGIVAAGLVHLGIATAYERSYGVLKRLGGAPIPRWGVLAAKAAALVVLEAIQLVVITGAAAVVFGWAPGPGSSPILTLVAVGIGTLTFAALGLLLAGTLRAEATLAAANGLFLAFLMLGGLALPVDQLPAILQPVAAALPATALADIFRIALDSGAPPAVNLVGPLALLSSWGVVAAVLAARAFRWE